MEHLKRMNTGVETELTVVSINKYYHIQVECNMENVCYYPLLRLTLPVGSFNNDHIYYVVAYIENIYNKQCNMIHGIIYL